MPYKMQVNKDGSVSVRNANTGKVHAKKTSKAKAKKQIRLMNAVDHGFVPTKGKK